jgi:hypothetical protein
MKLSKYQKQLQVNMAGRNIMSIPSIIDATAIMLMTIKVLNLTKTLVCRRVLYTYVAIVNKTGKLTKLAPSACRNWLRYSGFLKRKGVLA